MVSTCVCVPGGPAFLQGAPGTVAAGLDVVTSGAPSCPAILDTMFVPRPRTCSFLPSGPWWGLEPGQDSGLAGWLSPGPLGRGTALWSRGQGQEGLPEALRLWSPGAAAPLVPVGSRRVPRQGGLGLHPLCQLRGPWQEPLEGHLPVAGEDSVLPAPHMRHPEPQARAPRAPASSCGSPQTAEPQREPSRPPPESQQVTRRGPAPPRARLPLRTRAHPACPKAPLHR